MTRTLLAAVAFEAGWIGRRGKCDQWQAVITERSMQTGNWKRVFCKKVSVAIYLLKLSRVSEPHIHGVAVGIFPRLHESNVRAIFGGAECHRVGVANLYEISSQPCFVVNARPNGGQNPIGNFSVRAFTSI